MTAELDAPSSTPDTPPRSAGSRWPGAVLSLLVPGMGLVRAGELERGFFWFCGIQSAGLLIAYLTAIVRVPTWICYGAGGLVLLAMVAQLIDGARPGRMTDKLYVVFIGGLVVIAGVGSIREEIVTAYVVPTGAMEPTLRGASPESVPDRLYISRIEYQNRTPARGELVAFRRPAFPGSSESLDVKRLIGMPGEKLEIREGNIFVDGRRLDGSDGIPPSAYVPASTGQTVFDVPPGQYFFLGDNSPRSSDSRLYGPVPAGNLVGRVARIYYPFSRMGTPR